MGDLNKTHLTNIHFAKCPWTRFCRPCLNQIFELILGLTVFNFSGDLTPDFGSQM